MGMNRRTERQTQESDPYLALVYAHWDEIVGLYETFEDKAPVLQLNVTSKQIFAYPFDDFSTDLSERDQARIAEDREAVLSGKKMVIFVRDEDQQKMVSYSFKR